jgi:hypothetical protein
MTPSITFFILIQSFSFIKASGAPSAQAEKLTGFFYS